MKNESNFFNNPNFINEDNIDFTLLFNIIFRNKKLISFFSIIFFLIACLISLLKERTWEGQFQIVVDQSKAKNNTIMQGLNKLSSESSFLPAAINFSNIGNTSLQTEVGILQSPSVLMPIFDYVNDQRKIKDPNSEDLIFFRWKEKNLKVDLKKRTSILTISYRDNIKEQILPVLNKISNEYQKYSGKSKKRSIELGKEYLLDQIDLYKVKSSKTINIAQEFALKNDLSIFDTKNVLLKNRKSEELLLLPNSGIEATRLKALNDIKNIDLQIKRLKDLDDNLQKILYIEFGFDKKIEDPIAKDLENIQIKLSELQSKYTDNDPTVKRLVLKKDSLEKFLKEKYISILEAKKLYAQTLIQSSERPEGVLRRYKELIRDVNRNERILVNLENRLTLLNLEAAQLTDPWELITKPMLKKYPVAPKRKQIGILGLFLGLISGIIFSLIKEKRTDLIFEEKTIKQILNIKIIEKIDLRTGKFLNSSDILYREISKAKSEKNLKVLYTECIDTDQISKFRDLLTNQLSKENKTISREKISFINDLALVEKEDLIVLLTSLLNVTNMELNNIKNKIVMMNKSVYLVFLV